MNTVEYIKLQTLIAKCKSKEDAQKIAELLSKLPVDQHSISLNQTLIHKEMTF
jgi:hypothetical protein